MIQVTVTTSQSSAMWGQILPDQATADSWIAEQIAANSWGRPDRQVASNDPEMDNEDLSKSTGTETSANVLYYIFPADYTIVQTDISAQVAQQEAIAKGLAAQQVGAQAIAQVYAINDAKFAAGTLNAQDFQAILADTTLQMIERLLWSGSLSTAKSLIQTLNSPYFSSDDIASVVAILDASGLD